MPIIGMTRREDVTPKFPELGKLRKGGPKTDPKKPGPDLQYWRFTSERTDVLAAWNRAYPGNPTSIDAYLPFAKMEDNWQTWYEEYDAGGLRHRCDGRTMYRWRNGGGGYVDGERPCPYHAGTQQRTKDNPGCKQVGRLLMVVPQLIEAGYVGFVVMETHSINDLVSITASLLDAEEKAGKLTGIRFNVLRVKQTISTPAWKDEDKAAGKRNRTVKDLVKIVPASDWVLARLTAEAQLQMTAAQNGGALAATSTHPDYVNDDDDAPETDEPDDIEDGDYGPVPDAGASAEEAPFTRTLREFRELLAAQPDQEAPADKRTVGQAKWALTVLLSESTQRHALTLALLGEDDATKWTQAEALAVLRWIAPQKQILDDGQEVWLPTATAIDGAKIVLAEVTQPAEQQQPA